MDTRAALCVLAPAAVIPSLAAILRQTATYDYLVIVPGNGRPHRPDHHHGVTYA